MNSIDPSLMGSAPATIGCWRGGFVALGSGTVMAAAMLGPRRLSGQCSPAAACLVSTVRDHWRVHHVSVRALEPAEYASAAAVAARALRDAPSTVASYGDDPLDRMARTHRTFLSLFEAMEPPQLGAVCGACPIGVAVATAPGRCVGALFGPYASETLARSVPDYGDPAREQVFWATWAEHDLADEHWHIGPVGVEPGFQGRGIGGAILRGLCEGFDRDRRVAWLETDKEINVRFYQGVGFEVVEKTTVLDVPTWFMRRDPARR
ncbi:MAG: GNAT family N-acetyltransferase [Acidimicrobiales bacterium]